MNAKRKGNAFERHVCKQLSLWWSAGANDDLFWRTSNSGGRATVRAKVSKATRNAHNDICATDPSAQPLVDLITFEVKKGYNRYGIGDLLDYTSGVPTYLQWFVKARDTAAVAGIPHWMVVAKRDNRDAVCYFGVDLWDALWSAGADLPPSPDFRVHHDSPFFSAACVRFARFLELITPHNVRTALETHRKGKS